MPVLGEAVGEKPQVGRAELAFRLPVALPPPGRYEAFVRTAGGGVRARNLELDDGRVAITPALPARTGERLSLELVRPVLPG